MAISPLLRTPGIKRLAVVSLLVLGVAAVLTTTQDKKDGGGPKNAVVADDTKIAVDAKPALTVATAGVAEAQVTEEVMTAVVASL